MPKIKRLEKDQRDRISDLPSHIRQHILSFLSTRDALRSSILSTTWRHDWLSLPCLDFGKAFFHQHWKCADIWNTLIERTENDPAKASEFLTFLNQALIRPSPIIQKLLLFLPGSDELNSSIASCINGLSVYDLHLHISGPCLDSYYPPKCILTSISITKLSLYGLSLLSTPADIIQLPSLRDLSFGEVTMDQKMVQNLVANCPAVESMRFYSCKGFKLLKVVGLPKLKQFVGNYNYDLQRVEIDAPELYFLDYVPDWNSASTDLILSPSCRSLTRLWLHCWREALDWVNLHQKQLLHLKELSIVTSSMNVLQHVNLWATSLETLAVRANKNCPLVDITCCQNLADIMLSGHLSDDWLNRHLRLLSNLRVLQLHCCDVTPTRLNISSNSLEYLTIRNCRKLKHVKIDCRNLSNLTFWIEKSITSISLGAVFAPRCVGFHFIGGASIERLKYVRLIRLFKKLRRSKYLSLYANTLKNLIIPGELRQSNKSPLCQFKDLRLSLEQALTTENISACIDSLLWLCPGLKTIQITDIAFYFSSVKTQSEIYLKLEYKEPMELNPKGCGCYERLRINCWRHALKGFEIIKHYGVEDDGSLRRFFESAIIATTTRTDSRIKEDQRN